MIEDMLCTGEAKLLLLSSEEARLPVLVPHPIISLYPRLSLDLSPTTEHYGLGNGWRHDDAQAINDGEKPRSYVVRWKP